MNENEIPVTPMQSLAQFFGWDREKAIKVNQTQSEIAPNGLRRTRRINNDYIPSDEDIMSLEKQLLRFVVRK